ncbi:hypothetical protein ACLRAJ_15630 [Bordetella avium]|uniref:hypothetical protein n=1 Tax=Bordetella avium TaxID=521 RepID=UPI0039FC7C81
MLGGQGHEVQPLAGHAAGQLANLPALVRDDHAIGFQRRFLLGYGLVLEPCDKSQHAGDQVGRNAPCNGAHA